MSTCTKMGCTRQARLARSQFHEGFRVAAVGINDLACLGLIAVKGSAPGELGKYEDAAFAVPAIMHSSG